MGRRQSRWWAKVTSTVSGLCGLYMTTCGRSSTSKRLCILVTHVAKGIRCLIPAAYYAPTTAELSVVAATKPSATIDLDR